MPRSTPVAARMPAAVRVNSSLAVASGAMSGIVKLNSVSHSNSRVRSSLPSAPVASTVNM